MKKGILALALALTMLPVAAAAQSAPQGGPPALTPEQRQAMFDTFKTAHAQMEKLSTQLRAQVLGSISPVHRQAIASIIGQLAISPNPNRENAERQIDAMLSSGEKAQILAAHNAFKAQIMTLHQQLRKQMEAQMPAGAPPMGGEHPKAQWTQKQHAPETAGKIVMHVLGGGGHDMHGPMPMMHPM